jgi:hypothetical protein
MLVNRAHDVKNLSSDPLKAKINQLEMKLRWIDLEKEKLYL